AQVAELAGAAAMGEGQLGGGLGEAIEAAARDTDRGGGMGEGDGGVFAGGGAGGAIRRGGRERRGSRWRLPRSERGARGGRIPPVRRLRLWSLEEPAEGRYHWRSGGG